MMKSRGLANVSRPHPDVHTGAFSDDPWPALANAVRTVIDGGALLAPTVTLRMISQFARSPSPAQRDRVLAALTLPRG